MINVHTRLASIIVLAGLLYGCTSLDGSTVSAPPQTEFRSEIRVARLELPEVPGKGKLSASIEESLYAAARIKDTRATPSQQVVTAGSSNHHTVIAADFGLTDWLSTGLRIQPSYLTLKPGIRMQLVGDPGSRASVGNTSLSVGLGYLYSKEYSDEGIDSVECVLFVFCSGKDIKLLDVERSVRGVDVDVIAGYRPHQNVLVYGGAFYQNLVHRNTIRYTDRDAATRNVVSVTVNGDRYAVDTYGPVAGIALNLTPRLSVIAEYLRYQLQWQQRTLIEREESWGLSLRANL